MIEIRPAKEEDLEWLVGELREFDRFYGTKKQLFGDEKIVREKMLELIRTNVCLISEQAIESSSQKIGFIAGLIRPHFYNPGIRVLSELFWWVIPTKRRTPAASMMMDHFVEIGKAHADWITFSIASKCPVKKNSFVKRGFEVSDQVFLMEVS